MSCHFVYASSIHDQTHPLDSMHRCLNVDEIVRLIAYELVASGRKATAARLACCCRGFGGPVLDVLWATQIELSPLFNCLPGDIWNGRGRTVSEPATCSTLFSTVLFESLSNAFQRRRNGLVSENTLEECEGSETMALCASRLRRFIPSCKFTQSTNPYSQI